MHLEDDVGFLLARTHRAMRHYLFQRLHSLSVPLQQFIALVGLSEGDGISQDTLAKRMYTDMGFVTRILQHLEQEGMVTRGRDEHDARVRLVWLTPKGHALCKKIEAVRAEVLQEALQNLNEEEVKELQRLLNCIFSTVQTLSGYPSGGDCDPS